MDRAAAEQLLGEMLSSLEDLETKAGATLQFLKDKAQATDKDLAPYLEQAGNASNVRWRAARLRMMSLLGAALKTVEPEKDTNVSVDNAKTADVGKQTKLEESTAAEQPVQPQKDTEPQLTARAKESADKPIAVESNEKSKFLSQQDEASGPEERQPGADAKSTASKPKPSAEEAAKPPTQADREIPRKSKEDAA